MNLVFIYGPPASGKLTIANELVALTGYKLMDNHKATDYLLHLMPREEPGFEVARSTLGRKIRLLIFEAAAGSGINLVATFAPIHDGAHDFTRNVLNSVTEAGGNARLVQLRPNLAALEHRVQDPSRKDRKIDNIELLNKFIDKHPIMLERFPDTNHLSIDNSDMSAAEVAALISEHYNLLDTT